MSKSIPIKLQAARAKFESSREAFVAFTKENSRLVDEYDTLRDAVNSAIDDVKALYKDNVDAVGDNYGDFTARTRTEIDAERLVQIMGPIADPLVKMKWSIDRKAYDAAVAQGIVPQSVAKQVEVQSEPAIWGPKKV